MYVEVTNEGPIARTLGTIGSGTTALGATKFGAGAIRPGETRRFEGDQAAELLRLLALPEYRELVDAPKGLRITHEKAAVAHNLKVLLANPRAVVELPEGAAIKAINQIILDDLDPKKKTDFLPVLKEIQINAQRQGVSNLIQDHINRREREANEALEAKRAKVASANAKTARPTKTDDKAEKKKG